MAERTAIKSGDWQLMWVKTAHDEEYRYREWKAAWIDAEMVERAAKVMAEKEGGLYTYETNEPVILDDDREWARAVLTAALTGGET